MININLLPSARREPLIVFDRVVAAGLAIIAVEILAITGFGVVESMRISRLNDQIADWTQRVAVEQTQVKEVDDLRDQARDLQAKADLLERIKQSPLQLAEILNNIGDVTPHSVWLSNVIVSHEALGGSVALQGKTSQYRDVADLMLNLDSSPVFGNAILSSTTQQTGDNLAEGGNVTFSMVGQLSPAVVGQ
ncbi:MAG: PilN domain-containing protein [Candidatus Eremiobacteraeota bacterium]|nr:PilN domain-containing protein [Candidatus Eremiobacteraeota bacterium]MBC5827415.1 PilN domain-containing protein [Candidatus Eremiobacteraeota bacterium]